MYSIRLNQKGLKGMLAGTLFGTKATTHIGDPLYHVLFESKDNMVSLVTCDGYRVCRQSVGYKVPDFRSVLHVDSLQAVYKKLSANTYDSVLMEVHETFTSFVFSGYWLSTKNIDIAYIKPENYIPKSTDAEARIIFNPQQLLAMLPKPSKKPQRITLKLPAGTQYLMLQIPQTPGVTFDIKHPRGTVSTDIINTLNYSFFYQALNACKGDENAMAEFFEGYNGMVISSGDHNSYWMLPLRGEEE